MPTIDEFTQALANGDPNDQLSFTNTGGLALKSKMGRLKTIFHASTGSDRNMMAEFRQALENQYGKDIAETVWKNSGLADREQDGRPLSVRKVQAALQEATGLDNKAKLILAENLKYEQTYYNREQEAQKWDATPKASQVDGAGLRLARIDEGEFRLHNWTAKNNADPPAELELDELVEKEVAAIRSARQDAQKKGQQVEPMSERLMYLQAKLNLTERMVSEAAKPENLRQGGPSANIFLGPDMFFSPSDGPVVNGVKTYGGACTEEEMKQINEGLRKISEKYPQVTMMPGTVVWSKPSQTVPVIGGLPHPCDTVHNTGGVFHKGSLAHLVYKKTDGGDANWAAMGPNGVNGKCFTAPKQENNYSARLQIFPNNDQIKSNLGDEADKRIKPVLDEIQQMSDPLSPSREWENGLRQGSNLQRSPHNYFFELEGKPVALEICRDHTDGFAQKSYAQLGQANDRVANLAKQQPGPGGGVQLHVVLSASNMMYKNKTVVCQGGVAAQNDVSGGVSRTLQATNRVDQYNITATKPQNVFFNKFTPEVQKTLLKTSDQSPKISKDDNSVKAKVKTKTSKDVEGPTTDAPSKNQTRSVRSTYKDNGGSHDDPGVKEKENSVRKSTKLKKEPESSSLAKSQSVHLG